MSSMVNGKHLNVEVDFSANTSKAQKEIQNLQKQLNELLKEASKSTGTFALDEELRKASSAAIELKRHLNNAMNVDTGQFDVGALNRSFRQAGKTLEDYRISLSKLKGGNEVFSSIAKSILNAEVPLKRSSKLLSEFATTLKNTARWQISSSILHGFMGSLQSAFGYAKDLNESLNNIRIVTGQSTDQMAQFASEANKAAQALSTTTTKYTDAALIYYQQGLSDEEVKKRTDVTIKMANVSRQSAEEVSSQMTAVWNNFNKEGDQAEEHFADVMTKLGAETASSSSEIAEGLSKFAGIADTVGLSFDYAASALATITATSRESADVVGTSLKTIFSRLEGLKLGKTLDDGTELNQYSMALQKIGVNIKDASGELKDMDTILDETGKKWQTLTQDQKMATAQTVAGVRQYNQFITLMDNWDFMEKNIQRSREATGTLQEQADIYAESWEAAEKRVTAAAEEIYSKLLNDDFFIEMNNGIADFLSGISNTIDALGGLQGVISGLGLLITTLYKDQLANTLNNFFTTQKQRQTEWLNAQQQALTGLFDSMTAQGLPEAGAAYNSILTVTESIVANSKNLTAEQQEQLRLELEQLQNRAKMVEAYEREARLAEQIAKDVEIAESKAKNRFSNSAKERKQTADDILKNSDATSRKGKKAEMNNFDQWIQGQKAFTEETIKASAAYEKLVAAIGEDNAEKYVSAKMKEVNAERKVQQAIENTNKAKNDAVIAGERVAAAQDDLAASSEDVVGKVEQEQTKFMELGDVVVGFSQGIMSLSMAWSSLKGLGNIWSDQDMSTGDKILSTITSLTMALPMMINGFKSAKEAISGFGPALREMAVKIIETQAAEKGVTAASLSFGEALKTVAGSAISVIAPFAAIIAIATALGFAISSISKAYNKDANAAKEAAEASQDLASAYERTKNAYEDLKKELSDYDNARKALSELTAGTDEWKAKVIELNDQVLKLLDSYPELANYINNVNGLLDIESEGHDIILKKQEEQVKKASQSNMIGSSIKNATRNQSDITDLARELAGQSKGSAFAWENSLTGQADAEVWKDLLPKVIDAINTFGTSILKSKEDLVKALGDIPIELNPYIDKIINSSNSNENAIKDTNGNIIDVKAKIEQLATSVSANTEANKLYNKQVGENFIELKKLDFGDFKDAAAGIIGQTLNSIDVDKYNEEAIEDYAPDFNIEGYLEEIKEAMGADDYREDDSGKIEFLINNEWVPATEKEIKLKFAQSRAEEEVINKTQKLKDAFESLSKKFTDKKLLEVLTGGKDKKELTKKESEELQKSEYDYDKLSQSEKDNLKEVGIKDKDAYEGIRTSVKEGWDTFENGLSDGAKKVFANLGDLSLSASEQIDKSLKDASKNGKASFYQFGETLKTLSTDQIEKVSTALAGLDPTTKDFGEQLTAKLKEVGSNIPDAKINNLITALQALGAATEYDAEVARDRLKIAQNLSNVKDTISPEEYNKLSEAQQEYFDMAADGTYKLTTDAKTFYNVVKNEALDALQAQARALEQQIAALESATKYNYEQLSTASNSITKDKTVSQLDALTTGGYEDQEKVSEWKEKYSKGILDTQDYNDIAEAIKTIETQIKDGLNPQLEQASQTLEEVKEQAKDLMHSLDEDVNKEEWKDLTKYINEAGSAIEGLSDDVKDNKRAAEELSEEILRYDHALEQVQGNMKNWKELLESDNIQDQAQAVKELSNVYSDLLDIDSDSLSESFLTSADNLKLLEEAAKGSEEAYNKLQELAQQDIETHISLDNTEFWNAKTEVENAIDEMNFDSIEIGATLKDNGFYSQLENMINAAGMTAEEATSYLSTMGIDAEVEKADPETKQVSTTNQYWEPATYTTTSLSTGGEESQGSYEALTIQQPGHWEPVTETHTEQTAPASYALKVTSAHKSSGGKFKFKNASHGGGSAGRSARSSGGKRKGGGGGGSKKKDKKQPVQYQDEFDRYWQLNQTIKKVDNELDKLGKTYDYVFGKQRIKNLEDQNEQLKTQISNVKQLKKEQTKELKELKTKGKKYGAKFKDNYLDNYAKITMAQTKKLEAARQKFNKSGRTEADEKKYNKAKEKFDDFKKWLNRVTKLTQDELQESIERQKELIRQAVQNNYERWKLELDVKLDTRKAKRDWQTFLTKMKASLKDAVSEFSRTSVQKVTNNKNNFDSLNKDLKDQIDKRSELNWVYQNWEKYKAKTKAEDRIASSKSEVKKQMEELDKQISATADEMLNQINEAWSTYINRLNQTKEELDLVNERLERQGNILAYNRQLIELQYGDKAYQHMAEYYETELQFLKQKSVNYADENKLWEAQFNKAYADAKKRDSSVDIHNTHTWTQDMVLAYKNMNEAAEQYESTQLEIVKTYQDQYSALVDKAIYEAQIAQYGKSFDDYADSWERARKLADRYYDSVEKTYHIETLMNKIDQSVQDTKSLKIAEKLRKFRKQELEDLTKKEKLTKFDIEAANAHFEILQKEIALEEARENKNTMKLKRNEQGNWSYQYVANQDEVLKKEQDLRDAQQKLYDISKQEEKDMEDMAMQAQRDFWEEVRKGYQLRMTDEKAGYAKIDSAVKTLNEDLNYTVDYLKEANVNAAAAAASIATTISKSNPNDLKQINPDQTSLADLIKSYLGEDASFASIFTTIGGYGEQARDAFLKPITGGEGGEKGSLIDGLNTLAGKIQSTFTLGDTSFVSIVNKASTDIQSYLNGDAGLDNSFKTLFGNLDGYTKDYQTNVSTYFDGIKSAIENVKIALGDKGLQGEVKRVSKSAEKDLAPMRTAIKNILKEWQKIVGTDKKKGVLDKYKDKVKKIKSRTITITVKYKEVGKPTNYASVNNSGGGGGGSNNGGGTDKAKNKDKSTKPTKASKDGYRLQAGSFTGHGGTPEYVIRDKSGNMIKNTGYTDKKKAKKIANEWAKKNGYKSFATGGYTGSWDNTGKLAVLHQKELVLNKEDTKNMLDAVSAIREIKDLNSSISKTISDSLGSIILNAMQTTKSGTLVNTDKDKSQQGIVIENITAEFPNAENVNEIRQAILSLPQLASQYVSRNLK